MHINDYYFIGVKLLKNKKNKNKDPKGIYSIVNILLIILIYAHSDLYMWSFFFFFKLCTFNLELKYIVEDVAILFSIGAFDSQIAFCVIHMPKI